ncbi:MAG: 3-oxoacyl-ACP reductase [Acidobacteria bacterium]|nr:MAG: 3-oxoacyl-ACP reductase [Acidobacteriota bacterium]
MDRKTALVTGGSRGIGEAICHQLAKDGLTVVVAARNAEKIDGVVQAIRAKGGDAHGLVLDLSQITAFKSVIRDVTKKHGGLHVLVNNAGVTDDNLIMMLKEEAYDKVLDTNLKGPFFLSQAALRPMMKQRWGRIINISSVVGLMGNAGQANYAASKAGLFGFTKSLAREIASRQVTVNAIAPGYIQTDMTDQLNSEVTEAFLSQIPLSRFGQPEEVAHAVSFLASDKSAYITGQVLTVDGGLYM